MRLILQRVARAAVEVAGEVVGAIGPGLLVFAGIERGDGDRQVAEAAERVVRLRIFEDDAGRTNRDLQEAGGSVLLVSQFTVVADLRRGRRPSFDPAAPAESARTTIDRLATALRAAGVRVETGRFGARMRVSLVNDGPATFVLDFPPGEPHGARIRADE